MSQRGGRTSSTRQETLMAAIVATNAASTTQRGTRLIACPTRPARLRSTVSSDVIRLATVRPLSIVGPSVSG